MTAPWRLQLQPAKFREVPFSVRSGQTTVGRRTVLHEYPQRDEAFSEDLGRKAREFTVEGIIIGPDYFKARDALINALEQSGPGELVHPYYGRRTVALVGPARIAESADEGGMARFALDFVETGAAAQPSTRADTQSKVETAAEVATAAVAEDFAQDFTVVGQPEFVELSALDRIKAFGGDIDTLRKSLVPDMSIVSAYQTAVSGVMTNLNSLMRTPGNLAAGVQSMIGGLLGLSLNPFAALGALRGLFDHGRSQAAVPQTTPARVQQSINQEAVAVLVRRTAMIEASRAAATAEYESYDQAAAIRQELAEALDQESESASESVYAALLALRVAVVRDITTRGADLARVSTTVLPATLPAVVAAYRIYGDARRDTELITRNAGTIRHPGFVPGGQALEILVE